MNFGFMGRTGNNLHRLRVSAIVANIPQVAASPHQHFMPGKKLLVGKGRLEVLVEVDHHVGDALFRGRDFSNRTAQTEMPPNRRLHTVPIENLPLDGRARHGLSAQELHREHQPVRFFDVLDRPQKDPGPTKKFLLKIT